MLKPERPRAKRVAPPKSDWSPRPIPQVAEPLHTADPPTPTLRELAARERQRASVVARPDATRLARPVAPSAMPTRAAVPPISGPGIRVETALDRDPLGRDRLTSDERRRLGDLCTAEHCDKVQVYRGNGTQTANNLRADILKTSGGRSVTLGNHIFLSDQDRTDFAILAHEVEHTVQYEKWGAAKYFVKGAAERVDEMTGGNPYGYEPDGRTFDQYGMEQQGQIVEDYVRRTPKALRVPGVPKVGP